MFSEIDFGNSLSFSWCSYEPLEGRRERQREEQQRARLLRDMLGGELYKALGKEPSGRPLLSGRDHLDLSISHTRGLVVALLGAKLWVGVDVELLDRSPLGVDRLSTASERALVAEAGLEPIVLWACKEAAFKALHGSIVVLSELMLERISPGKLLFGTSQGHSLAVSFNRESGYVLSWAVLPK